MIIRKEKHTDQRAIFEINAAAFESTDEATLVDRLRQSAEPFISLVADQSGSLLGHIAFSPVTLTGCERNLLMGLAPMAVIPERQGQGIGSALVTAGLEQCKCAGCGAVVVLGHPEYYPRFGFKSSVSFGFKSEYDVPDEVFMALELEPGILQDASGVVRYHQAFQLS